MGIQTKPKGGARPGAGRKSNAKKLLEAGFVTNWFTREFQEIKWTGLANHKDANIQLGAMKYLTDRIYGKAVETHEHGNKDDKPLEIVVRHIGAKNTSL